MSANLIISSTNVTFNIGHNIGSTLVRIIRSLWSARIADFAMWGTASFLSTLAMILKGLILEEELRRSEGT